MLFVNFVVVLITVLCVVVNGLTKVRRVDHFENFFNVEESSTSLRGNNNNNEMHVEGATFSHALTYRGGRIVTKPKVVPVFASSEYGGESEITQFYKTLVTGSYYKLLSEYNVKELNQKFSAGSVTQPYVFNWTTPSTDFTFEEFQATLNSAITSGQLPPPTSNTIYAYHFQGTSSYYGGSCGTPGSVWCGIHGNYMLGTQNILYMLVPDFFSSNNCILQCGMDKRYYGGAYSPLVALGNTISHEIAEILTDPDPITGPLTWYNDIDGEVADFCGYRNALDEVVAGKFKFPVTKIWSNKRSKCVGPNTK